VVWWCGGVVVWWSAGVLVCRSVANSARQRRPAGAGDERRGCQREGDGEAALSISALLFSMLAKIIRDMGFLIGECEHSRVLAIC
jgi:hypothetical protein